MAISGLMIYNTADAQIRVGVNLGLAQPVAVAANPAFGNGDQYYYLPELGVYYDVTDQCYVYFDGTEWVFSAYLPGQYADFDWRTARRFEIDSFRPYLRDDFYRERYNGQRIADWGRVEYNNRFNGGYANRNERYDDRRNDDRDFGRRDDNRDYNRVTDHRDYANRGYERQNGGFNQPVQNRNFSRPAQPYRPEAQQTENRFKNQPADQNNNRGADNRGGNDHFAQNHGQQNVANRKMSKF